MHVYQDWGAVSIASFTQKAELAFDQGASGVTLDLDGTTLTDEQEIVRALAKAGGLSDESVKVRVLSSVRVDVATQVIACTDTSLFCTRKLSSEVDGVPRYHRCPRFCR